MFGQNVLDPIMTILDELADTEKGDRIAASVGKFTRKIYQGFVDAGFTPNEAFELTRAAIKKNN